MNHDDYDYSADAEAAMARESYALPDEATVLAGDPDTLDRDHPPGAKICTCGRAHDWVWWPRDGSEGRRMSSGILIRGRWTPPPVSPCSHCGLKASLDNATREMDRRQERAGIARVHRGYQWALALMQGADECWSEFAHTVKGCPGAVGVALADVDAFEVVSRWEPKHGSLFIHGPTGSGKSLWVSARLSDLARPTEGEDVYLDAAQLVNRGLAPQAARRAVEEGLNKFIRPSGLQLHQPLLIDEEDVVRRVENSWKGDPVPLLGISRIDVLAYDDMGTILLGASPKGKEHARVCIARLVDLRWREHRPFIITSNRSLGEICDALDRKTADRLREMVKHEALMQGVPSHVVAQGYSWRNLPPVGSGL